MDKPKIRFINTSYKTTFFVEDGEDIEIETDSGWKRYTCRYIDEWHFKLENQVCHIYEFALRTACPCRPVTTQSEKEAKDFIE